MITSASIHQSDILGRVLSQGAIPPEAAKYFAALELSPGDRERLNQLASKARQGALSDQEALDLEEFRRVGRLVEVLKLSARKLISS